MSNEGNLNNIHRKPLKFLRESFWWEYCQLRLKGTEMVLNEKNPLRPKPFKDGMKTKKAISVFLQKRKDDSENKTKTHGKPPQESSTGSS